MGEKILVVFHDSFLSMLGLKFSREKVLLKAG